MAGATATFSIPLLLDKEKAALQALKSKLESAWNEYPSIASNDAILADLHKLLDRVDYARGLKTEQDALQKTEAAWAAQRSRLLQDNSVAENKRLQDQMLEQNRMIREQTLSANKSAQVKIRSHKAALASDQGWGTTSLVLALAGIGAASYGIVDGLTTYQSYKAAADEQTALALHKQLEFDSLLTCIAAPVGLGFGIISVALFGDAGVQSQSMDTILENLQTQIEGINRNSELPAATQPQPTPPPPVQASVQTTAANASLCPQGVTREYQYVPFPVHITLDSNLDDWNKIPKQKAYTRLENSWGPVTPGEDESLEAAFAADEEYLYFMLRIVDKTVITGKNGQDWYKEDSAELYLNFNNTLGQREYNRKTSAVCFKPIDPYSQPTGIRINGKNMEYLDMEGTVFNTKNGWALEGRLPLKNRIKLEHGYTFGMNFQLNGTRTSEGRTTKIGWSKSDPSDNSWLHPDVWGRAVMFRVGSTDAPKPSK